MDNIKQTKELILKYFHSWQEPVNYNEFRNCLADDVKFDSNMGYLEGGQILTDMIEKNAAPWKDIRLLSSMFSENQGTLFYEGTNKNTSIVTRVAEYIEIRDGLISRIVSSIATKKSN